jgi:hypothetical protein
MRALARRAFQKSRRRAFHPSIISKETRMSQKIARQYASGILTCFFLFATNLSAQDPCNFDDLNTKFKNQLDANARIMALPPLFLCAVRSDANSTTLAKTLLVEAGFWVDSTDALQLTIKLRASLASKTADMLSRLKQRNDGKTPTLTVSDAIDPNAGTALYQQLLNTNAAYNKAAGDRIAAFDPAISHPEIFSALGKKDGPTGPASVTRVFALGLLADPRFAPLEESRLLSSANDPNIDDVARAFLISKLATFQDADVISTLNGLLQNTKVNKSQLVRYQIAVVLGAIASTNHGNLDYLGTLAGSYLSDTDKDADVPSADQQALTAIIGAVVASDDDDVHAAATKALRDPLKKAVGILKAKKPSKSELQAAIFLVGQAGRLFQDTDPAYMVSDVIPAILPVFANQHEAVAQSIGLIGPIAYTSAYGVLAEALFSIPAPNNERSAILSAITSIAAPADKASKKRK